MRMPAQQPLVNSIGHSQTPEVFNPHTKIQRQMSCSLPTKSRGVKLLLLIENRNGERTCGTMLAFEASHVGQLCRLRLAMQ
jgi:hypothetical protein